MNPINRSIIKHLDLSNRLSELDGNLPIKYGSSCDIFKARCNIEGRGEIEVAAKCIRIHADFEGVCHPPLIRNSTNDNHVYTLDAPFWKGDGCLVDAKPQ